MPKYSYQCDQCGAEASVLRPKPVESFVCKECTNGTMLRALRAATARMVEILDNGLMTRRVERPANAEQLYKDRARETEADKNKL